MISQGRWTYIIHPVYEFFDPVVEIGNFCSLAEGITFCGAMHHIWVSNRKLVSTYPFPVKWFGINQQPYGRGPIVIGSDVWIGTRAFIMDGIYIGHGAIVGAGALVSKDIPPYAIVAGNPARIRGYRFTPEQIEKLLAIAWWNWDDETIKQRMDQMEDIDLLLENYG